VSVSEGFGGVSLVVSEADIAALVGSTRTESGPATTRSSVSRSRLTRRFVVLTGSPSTSVPGSTEPVVDGSPAVVAVPGVASVSSGSEPAQPASPTPGTNETAVSRTVRRCIRRPSSVRDKYLAEGQITLSVSEPTPWSGFVSVTAIESVASTAVLDRRGGLPGAAKTPPDRGVEATR
jgi:hypothetical protein